MTSLFSSVSTQFGKALLLGTMLPVIAFLALGSVLFELSVGGAPLDLLMRVETGSQALAISLITVTLSGLLHNLNVPLTRLYEGYPWRDTWLGQRRVRHYASQHRALNARFRGLAALGKFVREQKIAESAAIRGYRNDIGRRLNAEFPINEASVLPTRLGNVIRSFENYPRRLYGMSAIPLWPRLLAKIDQKYAESIDETKTAFDFALNCSFLACVLALALVTSCALMPLGAASLPLRGILLLSVAGLVFLSHRFYEVSIGRAAAWGNMVKGAFDLYRRELLTQLGYEEAPKTWKQERAVWSDISQLMLFGDSLGRKTVDFVPTSEGLRAEAASSTVAFELTRGIRPLANGSYRVTVSVRNVSGAAIESVVLTDTIESGFSYEWGSSTHSVNGANPYQFQIDKIGPKQSVDVSFTILNIAVGVSTASPVPGLLRLRAKGKQ